MKINVNGGHTPTAPGASGYLDELACDRAIKNELIRILRERGHDVSDSTSPDDKGANADLSYQASTANASGAELAVSIHLNAGGGTGTEVWYYPGSAEGANYASAVSSRVASALGLRDRGPKSSDGLYWLRSTSMTAILVEVCFVDTWADKVAYDAIGATGVATAIANAIVGEPSHPETQPSIPVYQPSHDVQIWEQNATDAQKWWMRQNEDGTVSFRCASCYEWLSVPNANTNNGTRVQVWGGDGTKNAEGNDSPRGLKQCWKLVPTSREGVYLIASALDDNKVLDVNGGGTAPGTAVQLYDKTGKYNQQWYLYKLDDSSYRIVNCGSFKLLDVVNGGI